MLSVCVFSAGHIAEVLAGVTLSVNASECWHARGRPTVLHDLHGLLRT